MQRDTWKTNWLRGEQIGKGGQGITFKAKRVDGADPADYILKQLKDQANPERRA